MMKCCNDSARILFTRHVMRVPFFCHPFIAVKCNDSSVVIQTLAAFGTGFDCASKGEIAKVQSFGVPAESIIFANPTKPISHLKYAAENNVDLMTVDSDFELYKIQQHYPNARWANQAHLVRFVIEPMIMVVGLFASILVWFCVFDAMLKSRNACSGKSLAAIPKLTRQISLN